MVDHKYGKLSIVHAENFGSDVTTATTAGDPSLYVSANTIKVKTGAIKQVCIAGGAAGDHSVTGITTADEVISVVYIKVSATAAVADLTSEFTITGSATINNAAGTNTTGGYLLCAFIIRH